MKVLFAVNSESISDAIIKKYQKDYREILSYKNVYYFNAIQKEIQKDKSYDRIVISEDLEPFSNNNYESIDKFIFEKLDSISDEAHDMQGKEMSIILIASDRHTKGSSFLVKIFGIGVYNALLGNDRSMEEVCRLINKPRTKKEAKMYYKIDTDDVNYKAENEDEVSELEIKNIISHFKKLGKSTEKYSGSFENIATQYTDEQLKVIINCLPMSVKAVLEGTSSKYQEIMSVNGNLVKGIKSSDVATREAQKRTGIKIDIIENKLNQNKMTKPIVIPNSVKAKNRTTAPKKIMEVDADNLAEIKEKSSTKVISAQKKNIVSQKPVQKTKLESEDMQIKKSVNVNDSVEENKSKTVKPTRKVVSAPVNVAPKKVPSKIKEEELDDIELPDIDFANDILIQEDIVEKNKTENPTEEQAKKRRGRPRKTPIETETEIKPKGKRGRPRKKIEEEDIEEVEEFEELEDLENFEGFDFEDTVNDSEEIDFLDDELEDVNEQSNEKLEDEEFLEIEDSDELDDLEDFELEDDFDIEETEDDAFDEFEDYDEYGKYSTNSETEEDIDALFDEDILSEDDENNAVDLLNELDDDEFEEDVIEEFELEDDEEGLNEFSEEVESISDFEDDFSIEEFETNDLEAFEDEDDIDLLNKNEFEDMDELSLEDDSIPQSTNYDIGNSFDNENETMIESIKSPIDYSMSNLNSLMTKDKKIVTFLGTSKNGVSFLVNSLAEIFASVGINTAILDMTKNKNSYYIYTQNEEALRKLAYSSIENLQSGIAEGIKVKQNLTVYTALPNDGKDYSNAEPILSTLVQNHSLVLVDCDFETAPSYFGSCQEIYLVQSMDILTIQPLTAFLRDLKTQGVLEPEKVRVVINKELKVRGLTNKAIIGGMAFYNDPAMSFMTELFNKDIVKYCSIPFEEMAYSKYLESILNCKVSVSGYSKNFMNKLRILGDMVYPLTSRQNYKASYEPSYNQNGFSNSMNDTLNKMRKKY